MIDEVGAGILAFLAAHLFSTAWLYFSRDAAFCSSVIIPSVLSFNFY
jgi:hypothetical protein